MVMLEKDIHLQYTEALTKKSVLYYCWAMTGNRFVIALILSVLGLAFLLQNDDSSPMVISVIIFTLIWVPVFLGILYYVTNKRALTRFRNLPDGKAMFGMTPDHFSLKVGDASTNLPWTSISRVHQYKDFWIVMLRPRGYFTLPTHNLMPEDKVYILKHIVNRRSNDRGLFSRERQSS